MPLKGITYQSVKDCQQNRELNDFSSQSHLFTSHDDLRTMITFSEANAKTLLCWDCLNNRRLQSTIWNLNFQPTTEKTPSNSFKWLIETLINSLTHYSKRIMLMDTLYWPNRNAFTNECGILISCSCPCPCQLVERNSSESSNWQLYQTTHEDIVLFSTVDGWLDIMSKFN